MEWNGSNQERGAHVCEPGRQFAARFVVADRGCGRRHGGSGVHSFVELHDGDARPLVSGQHRSLHRCGTSPTREEREVDVEEAGPWNAQGLGANQHAEGHDDGYVERSKLLEHRCDLTRAGRLDDVEP